MSIISIIIIIIIIYHNLLLLTKFGTILQYVKNDVNIFIVDYNAQKTEQLTKKTWGQGWVVLVVSTKWQIYKEEIGNYWLKVPHFSLSPLRVAFSRMGWFSRALAFRSLYYPWGKMGDYS